MKRFAIISIGILAICTFFLVFTNGKKNGYSDFEIVDETGICAEALEGFYSDSVYDYYFPCIKSKTTFVKFADGRKITVANALKEGLVTIKELEEKGLQIYKELKSL